MLPVMLKDETVKTKTNKKRKIKLWITLLYMK